jgi:hypothetical protein
VVTDRTIPNNKLDVIICDIGKGTCMLTDVTISGDRNVIEKETEKILKYKDLTLELLHMWNVNNRGNWNRLRIIKKIPEQHSGKARNYGTTENGCCASHTYFRMY